MIEIVGWGVLQGDEECSICGGGASVYIDSQKAKIPSEDLMSPCCKKCAEGGRDRIAERLLAIFSPAV